MICHVKPEQVASNRSYLQRGSRQRFESTLGQSTPVDVITLRRIVSGLRRSITPTVKVEAEVAAEVVEAVAEVEAVETIEEVQFDAVEEFAVGSTRNVRRMQPWRAVFYDAFDLSVLV